MPVTPAVGRERQEALNYKITFRLTVSLKQHRLPQKTKLNKIKIKRKSLGALIRE